MNLLSRLPRAVLTLFSSKRPLAGLRGACAGRTAYNAAALSAEMDRAVAVAFNISLEPTAIERAADWFMLCPFFDDGTYYLQEGGSLKPFRQVFSRPQADQMVAAFNAASTRRGTNWRGLPVYAGHPDCDPQRWPDDRRIGSLVALEARRDSLWCKVAWNELGRQNMTQSYLCYPSPAWKFDLTQARRTGTVCPDELQSVGMTNSPNIPQVPAWTNQASGVAVAANSVAAPRVSGEDPAMGANLSDLSTATGRRRAFNARVDELTMPAAKGGRGFTFEQALAEMRDCPADRTLLAAMGDVTSQR